MKVSQEPGHLMKVSGFAAALCCALAEQQSASACLTLSRFRAEQGQVGYGVLERRHFEVGVPVVHCLGRVAGEFHPQFFGNAGVGQDRIETVPKRMERSPGKLPEPFALNDSEIDSRVFDNPFESLGQTVLPPRSFAREIWTQKPGRPEFC